MKRVLGGLLAVGSLIMLVPSTALAHPEGGCQDQFTLVEVGEVEGDIGSLVDRNGDGFVCTKTVPAGRGQAEDRVLVIDNNANEHAVKND